jgi:hypothetical protein
MLQRDFLNTFSILAPIYVIGIGIALLSGGIAGVSPAETDAVRMVMGISGLALIVLAIIAEYLVIKRLSCKQHWLKGGKKWKWWQEFTAAYKPRTKTKADIFRGGRSGRFSG